MLRCLREMQGILCGLSWSRPKTVLKAASSLVVGIPGRWRGCVADGHRIHFRCCGFELEGHASGGGLEGTGKAQGEAFSWKAQAAPGLPARPNLEWGEPVDLLAVGMEGWKARPGDAATWKLVDAVLVNSGRGANIYTTDNFKDFKLHIEVNCPEGSNSGIYLHGRYEIQVQDDYGKPPYSRHMGGIYGDVTPSSECRQTSRRVAGARRCLEWSLGDAGSQWRDRYRPAGDPRNHGGRPRFQ